MPISLQRLSSLRNLPILLALALLFVGVMMKPVHLAQAVYEIQITFDISQSMNVEDVEINNSDVSRLAYSKAAALDLMRSLPCGSRIGWSIFAGQRSLPLTTPLDVCQHYAGLLSSLDRIDGRMRWANASSVGKGLHQSMRAAQAAANPTTLVFISDGHEAPPLRHAQHGIPNTDRLDVQGLVLGVGGATPVAVPKSNSEGRDMGYWRADEVVQRADIAAEQSHEELSRLHGEHMVKLAQLAKLEYVPLDSVNALTNAMYASTFSHKKSIPTDLRWLPLSLALIALCWRLAPWNLGFRPWLDLQSAK
jgi:mxaL protein